MCEEKFAKILTIPSSVGGAGPGLYSNGSRVGCAGEKGSCVSVKLTCSFKSFNIAAKRGTRTGATVASALPQNNS